MEITPQELKKKIDAKECLDLIDVREPQEYALCHLEDAKLIPMRELPARIQELNPEKISVVYCHHGMRSMQVVLWLQKNGFKNTRSLKGGIEAWALEIDPKLARY